MAKDKRKKNADEGENAFSELRKSQGYLSFVRARYSRYSEYDMWGEFDVISMNADVLELAQVKANLNWDSRGAKKAIRKWMKENAYRLPDNLRCVVAIYHYELKQFRIHEVEINV